MQIRQLMVDRLWDIVGFCPLHPERQEGREEGDAERYRQGQHRRVGFLARKMDEGARLQVAYRGGVAVGFIEYYLIEVTNLELAGQDIVAVWCMLASEEQQGIDSALLQACLDDAQSLGRKGVAVTCWDPIWTPRAFFERFGFVEVGTAGRNGVVLFKPFAEVEPSRWVGRKPAMELVEGKIAVAVYYTDRCPIHWRNTALIREIASELGEAVLWRAHWTDEREDMQRYRTTYGVYINGERVAAGPAMLRERVRQALSRHRASL